MGVGRDYAQSVACLPMVRGGYVQSAPCCMYTCYMPAMRALLYSSLLHPGYTRPATLLVTALHTPHVLHVVQSDSLPGSNLEIIRREEITTRRVFLVL